MSMPMPDPNEDVVDAELVGDDTAPSTDLALVDAPASVTLFGTDDPNAVIERATAHARALVGVVNAQQLASNISGRQHVQVEGWTLLGSMVGVFPVTEWTAEIKDHNGKVTGYKARVRAVTRDGSEVGAGESLCMKDEANWKNKPDYAVMAMAETRATSRALRRPLGYIMKIAGYHPVSTEEIRDALTDDEKAPPPNAIDEASRAELKADLNNTLTGEQRNELKKWGNEKKFPAIDDAGFTENHAKAMRAQARRISEAGGSGASTATVPPEAGASGEAGEGAPPVDANGAPDPALVPPEPKDEPPLASQSQRTMLILHIKDALGDPDRPSRIAFLKAVCGRQIESATEVRKDEVDIIVKTCARVGDNRWSIRLLKDGKAMELVRADGHSIPDVRKALDDE